ncbi:MAG: bifunctional oligoribonuclease/PAP phosphatase NrnA [Planctomycetota bacterium]|nr:bifunctional oligoribonuclease/PAP phosphatase NrnA [Planctomycetota bacterium]
MDYRDAWKMLEKGKKFLVTSHIYLDGDAVASELVVAKVLRSLGKEYVIVNEHAVPRFLRFLPKSAEIKTYSQGTNYEFDTAVVLDIGAWKRMGLVSEMIDLSRHKVLNIDHHCSNDGFGENTLVDSEASSTGEILFHLLKENGFEIDEEAAFLLYVALFTDTGRFTYDNTSPVTLRIAADLLDKGVDTQKVVNEVYRSMTDAQLALQARALSRLAMTGNKKIAWITLYWKDFEETGGEPDDTQEFAEFPRSVAGVVIGMYVREMEDGRVKVSMRSNGGVDLNKFAMRYGGGGHKSAAGITFSGMSVEAVTQFVVSELSKETERKTR